MELVQLLEATCWQALLLCNRWDDAFLIRILGGGVDGGVVKHVLDLMDFESELEAVSVQLVAVSLEGR